MDHEVLAKYCQGQESCRYRSNWHGCRTARGVIGPTAEAELQLYELEERKTEKLTPLRPFHKAHFVQCLFFLFLNLNLDHSSTEPGTVHLQVFPCSCISAAELQTLQNIIL